MTRPISKPTVLPADEDDTYRAMLGEEWRRVDPDGVAALERSAAALDLTDWSTYRKCSQVCAAPIGEPCVSLSGKVVNGRPDGVRTVLAVPHNARKRRTVRKTRS